MSIRNFVRRIRYHLDDIRYAIDYPDVMFHSLPRGVDVRGEKEMELYYGYLATLIAKRAPPISIFDASSDVNKAGYKPRGLE